MDTKSRFRRAVKKSCKILLRQFSFNANEPEKALELLFSDVIYDTLAPMRKDAVSPKAEDIAIALIRLGVPRGSVHAGFSEVKIPLRHSTYRLERQLMSPQGAVQVHWNGLHCVVIPTLSAEDLARALLDLDELLPKLDAYGKTLVLRIGAERRAAQIERTAVKAQLDAVIPALGIECSFSVKDGTVHLDLSRLFQGFVDIPTSELAAFLADPERILSVLHPPHAGYVREEHDSSYHGPHFRFSR